ncbi:MAG: response regulator [Rubrobacter sp.]|nr:response regulator [Rubrobacter sp.]
MENAERRVVAALEDLLFRSKINETAENLEGVEAAFPRSPKKLMESLRSSPPDLLVLDLNSARFEPLKILAEIEADEALKNIPTVGFLSHVQKDLAVAAKEYGCDRVMARSAFTQKLPEVLAGAKADAEGAEEIG